MKSVLARIALAAPLLLLAAGCANSELDASAGLDLERRVMDYVSAANDHDADAMFALMTEDARWQLPTRKESIERDTMRSALELDAALSTEMEIVECTTRGLIVNCTSIERSDWLTQVHGIEQWNQPQLRFVFTEEGLIRMVKWVGVDEATMKELRVGSMAFREWALSDEERTQRYYSMVDKEKEQLRWDGPTGETLLSMGREWVDAGRPGIEEARARYAEKMKAYEEESKKKIEESAPESE